MCSLLGSVRWFFRSPGGPGREGGGVVTAGGVILTGPYDIKKCENEWLKMERCWEMNCTSKKCMRSQIRVFEEFCLALDGNAEILGRKEDNVHQRWAFLPTMDATTTILVSSTFLLNPPKYSPLKTETFCLESK